MNAAQAFKATIRHYPTDLIRSLIPDIVHLVQIAQDPTAGIIPAVLTARIECLAALETELSTRA